MSKKNKNVENVENVENVDGVETELNAPEQEIDTELVTIIEKLNHFLVDNGVLLQPYLRPVFTKDGMKIAEQAMVTLVRAPQNAYEDKEQG